MDVRSPKVCGFINFRSSTIRRPITFLRASIFHRSATKSSSRKSRRRSTAPSGDGFSMMRFPVYAKSGLRKFQMSIWAKYRVRQACAYPRQRMPQRPCLGRYTPSLCPLSYPCTAPCAHEEWPQPETIYGPSAADHPAGQSRRNHLPVIQE